MGLARRLTDPDIGKHLLRDEGEVIVDEVGHHWVVFLLPALEVLGALALLLAAPFVAVEIAWVPMVLAALVLLHAGWRALEEHMDRFVVTNMRVFRVRGVLGQQVATMPLSRILDITVRKPLHGRLLGFGHFVFESAAQEQGLRDIRYVARPDARDLAIQRVIARAGLRPSVN
ncbi:PH domain-containing protein [Nocardioides jiangxiensis]|uniref:PH domain-containing protein n=1 Tax=Nocardioides jiangxiensis TaxID=3064524 RepID=A0ABT9AYW3_9ACTN|nr:PH domain-containing protein [Nocardioides sp. WY-20]MDO7867285.1 PH domain-containing protein [Nocardioides sp. WY-20]